MKLLKIKYHNKLLKQFETEFTGRICIQIRNILKQMKIKRVIYRIYNNTDINVSINILFNILSNFHDLNSISAWNIQIFGICKLN